MRAQRGQINEFSEARGNLSLRYSRCCIRPRIDSRFARRAVRPALINERAKGMQIVRDRDRRYGLDGPRLTNQRRSSPSSFALVRLPSLSLAPSLSFPFRLRFFSRARISLSKTYRRGFFSASVIYQSPSFSGAPHSIHADPTEGFRQRD